MPTSPSARLGLIAPTGTDDVDLYPAQAQAQVTILDNAAVWQQGTLAARPTATSVAAGTFYRATDTNAIYLSDAIIWRPVPQNYAIFGDGSDGTVTLDGVTTVPWATLAGSVYTMTRDCYCTTLTINGGVSLATENNRVLAQFALVNSGTITGNGAAGGNPQGASAGLGGITNAGSYAGSTGGGGGSANSAGQNAPGGRQSDPQPHAPGVTGGGGGNGGAGGGNTAGLGQANSGWPKDGPARTFHELMGLRISARSTISAMVILQGGGAGGGGAAGGSPSLGGGGAGGGGFVLLAAPLVTNNGSVSAVGGTGASGSGAAGGGGGGGGGGFIGILGASLVVGTTNVAGGAGGSGSPAGAAGSVGAVVTLQTA